MFEWYDSLREELLVLNSQECFCWFLFFVGIEKNTLIWYKVYVLRKSYRKKCRSDYWCVTWVENPFLANCGLVVQIVVSRIHQKCNRRCLMYRKFNYLCIRNLRFWLLWTWHTTICNTSPQFARDGFQPRSRINNHFDIFLRSLYLICRPFTNVIATKTEMKMRCAWDAGKTCVIRIRVEQRTDPCYYMVKYSHTGLENVSRSKSEFLDLLWESTTQTDPKNLYTKRGRTTRQMTTLENWSGYLDKLGRTDCVIPALSVTIR